MISRMKLLIILPSILFNHSIQCGGDLQDNLGGTLRRVLFFTSLPSIPPPRENVRERGHNNEDDIRKNDEW